VGRLKIAEKLVAFRGDIAQAGDDQIVLGAEMAVEGHLVSAGLVGDGIDAHATHAVAPE
jgi:hypothetical protein